MKYGKKTLEELKKIVDRAIALGDITNQKDITAHLEGQIGNLLLPENARRISRKIQALIDGTSTYEPQDEREIEQFISDLKGKSNDLSASRGSERGHV